MGRNEMKLVIIDKVNGIGFVTLVVGWMNEKNEKPVKIQASKLMLLIWSPESKMLANLCNMYIVMGLLH